MLRNGTLGGGGIGTQGIFGINVISLRLGIELFPFDIPKGRGMISVSRANDQNH